MRFLIVLFLGTFFYWNPIQAEQRESLLIFAAASLKDALEEIVDHFEIQTGEKATVSFAASSVLARQIQAKAPADIFISADQKWMDYVVEKSVVNRETLKIIALNSLVIIGSNETTKQISLNSPNSFIDALGEERFAVGDPSHVPSGRYAKMAFESLKIWDEIENKIVPADNTRVALALVARNEVPLGVVYESDAQSDRRVQVLANFDEDLHPAIIYSAVATKIGDSLRAEKFIKFLTSEVSRKSLLDAGFQLIK